LDKWSQKIINIMVLNVVKTIAGWGKTGAPIYVLGMFWGGVPGLSEGWRGSPQGNTRANCPSLKISNSYMLKAGFLG